MKCAQGQIVVGNEEVGIGQLKFALPNLSKGLEKYLTIIVAWVFAVVLLGMAVVLAFPSNSLFGGSALFITNKAQGFLDLAYFAVSIGFLVIALQYEKVLVKFMQLIGKVYMAVALIGFAKLGSPIYSEWVAVINLGLGMSFVAAGFILQDYRQRLLVARLIAKQRQPGRYTIVDVIKNHGLKTT
ncbi:MAG: hypothetical protein O7D95_01115 [Betaproteobacteria bacterium]|jgi:hypothetical protein|nr:hypothetical protein [Betaproteobacteria bacterium]